MSDYRIKDAIRRLGSDQDPPPGWEDRVIARVTRRGCVMQLAVYLAVLLCLAGLAAVAVMCAVSST